MGPKFTTARASSGIRAAPRFIGKGVEPAQLLDAIRVVAAGDALLSPRATKALLSSIAAGTTTTEASAPPRPGKALDVLTEREPEVVALAARGLANDQIAEQLYLSPLTVKTHANRAMMKLDVHDRAQLVALAYRTGLVRPGDDP